MSTALAQRNAQLEIQQFFTARSAELAKALPSHIRPDYFQRAVMTAIASNPKLLDVDRRSLWNASLKCAQDGLTPDGREAAFVIFKGKDGDVAQYLRMVGGIRKLVQQSGEITRFEQTVVHANDQFDFRLGDRPHIHHKPVLDGERGPPIAVYSVAQFRNGTLSREIMTVAEIEYVRHNASRAANDGPWVKWWPEMAKKTVARRHAKVLPMSSDVAAAIETDEPLGTAAPLQVERFADTADPASLPAARAAGRPRIAESFDTLASSPGPGAHVAAEATEPGKPKRPRGRPRKSETMPAAGAATTDHDVDTPLHRDVAEDAPAPAPVDEDGSTFEDYGDAGDPGPDADRAPVGDVGPTPAPRPGPIPDPDYERGWRDARSGAKTCLNSAIKADLRRYASWQAGFDAYHRAEQQAAAGTGS